MHRFNGFGQLLKMGSTTMLCHDTYLTRMAGALSKLRDGKGNARNSIMPQKELKIGDGDMSKPLMPKVGGLRIRRYIG
jgi:hypothetical protein